MVLPDSMNAVSGVTNNSEKVDSHNSQSSDNLNKSANGDYDGHSKKKSDRSGRKLTTLLKEDISNGIEEVEKSLEEEKRAVIEACRYSPSSLCQLVRIDKQKFIQNQAIHVSFSMGNGSDRSDPLT